MPKLILFDLDGTLIAGDSDFEWGNFMCTVGAVDQQDFQEKNQRFYQQYLNGDLDIHEYLAFALQPFAEYSLATMLKWREEFIQSHIKPLITAENKALVKQHQEAGNQTVIITATNRFVTQPIADLFAVDDLIATELEMRNEKYTGLPAGIPCFREGKVERLQRWLDQHNMDYQPIWFYSDSINDMPLLEYVDKPIIKNGDAEVTKIAAQRGWTIL